MIFRDRELRAAPGIAPALLTGHGPSPVTRGVSDSRTAPAWDTRPRPSAETVILELRALFFTWKVPSARCGQDPR